MDLETKGQDKDMGEIPFKAISNQRITPRSLSTHKKLCTSSTAKSLNEQIHDGTQASFGVLCRHTTFRRSLHEIFDLSRTVLDFLLGLFIFCH